MKVLIKKTASSLDDTALKMLFVSVQQNNIDLCVRYAINKYAMFSFFVILGNNFFSLTHRMDALHTVCSSHRNINDFERLNLIQNTLIDFTLSWFGHSYVSECCIH